jgi:alanine racemase
MEYTIHKIAEILNVTVPENSSDQIIDQLVFDTRKIVNGSSSLFFCLQGVNRDGHEYIERAFSKGVRHFVVARNKLPKLRDAIYLCVDDVLPALQKLATYHKNSCTGTTIIGITGSNAKTIVKEWLFQILHSEKATVRSPKSYNSQIGVPISLWEIKQSHQIAIIEAGVSEKGEMKILADMIQPEIGIFTNIGDAHSSGFKNLKEKILEKTKLFRSCKQIICSSNHPSIIDTLSEIYGRDRLITWGKKATDNYTLTLLKDNFWKLTSDDYSIDIEIPNYGPQHFENIMHVVVTALHLGISTENIKNKISLLHHLEMRLEHIKGKNNSLIINDAYVADIASLKVALEHINTLKDQRPLTLVMSDFSGLNNPDQVNKELSRIINSSPVRKLITVGQRAMRIEFTGDRLHFPDTTSLIASSEEIDWNEQVILIKGARNYALEALVPKLESASHSACLEINIPALHHNLTEIKKQCNPGCGIIPVLKASAYGAGIENIADAIQSHDPSYIAVAYSDEGVKLRLKGISTPIIILNPDEGKTDDLFRYNLEPSVHNLILFDKLNERSEQLMQPMYIHLKLDTGMHRLGFREEELNSLIHRLSRAERIKINSIYSHLSSSEDPDQDKYTHRQAEVFNHWSNHIISSMDYRPTRHLLNSEGIWRFSEYQFDAVRAGLGMYGISGYHHNLKKVHSLYAKIISIKSYSAGDAIGYGRSETLEGSATIGVINIGYADGLMRSGSNGRISVAVHDTLCPIIGKICMDVAMVNLTQCPSAKVGDTVEIFGYKISLEKHASDSGTIPYEILCGLSTRIIRRYIMD